MNVSEYIDSGRKVITKKPIQLHVTKKQQWSKEAKHLYRMFLTFKGVNIVRIPLNSAVLTVFEKLATRIQEYEKKTQTTVNLKTYFKAHKQWFGKKVYPAQLISSFSWDLYQAFEKITQTPLYEIDDTEMEILEAQTLQRLAKIRHEPERITLLQLKNSGLFSSRFLRKRKIS